MQALLLGLFSLALPLSDARIEGRVVDHRGAPAAGVRVILGEIGHATLHYNTPGQMFVTTPGLTDAEGPRYAAELRTDRDGRFVARGLARGEFSIVAAGEHALALASARSDERPPCLEIALQPAAFVEAKVAGLSFDRSTHVLELKPRIACSNVMLVPRLAQEIDAWTFRSAPLPPIAGWQIVGTEVVMAQAYRATRFNVPVDAAPGETARLDLRFDGGLALSGRVLGPAGEPLPHVSVVARALDRELRDPLYEIGAITDARGEFEISGLSPGRWTLEARRWALRDLPGCGNGRLELQTSVDVALPLKDGERAELVLAAFQTAPKVGERAPEFDVATIDGEPLRLSSLRGKVVLLDFWATWCGMCRVEMPRLRATHEELVRDGRFEIVGISLDEDPDLVRRFVASRRLAWKHTALGLADQNAIARLYNVTSTPATVLIDREGAIAALNLTGDGLRKRIDGLLAAK